MLNQPDYLTHSGFYSKYVTVHEILITLIILQNMRILNLKNQQTSLKLSILRILQKP